MDEPATPDTWDAIVEAAGALRYHADALYRAAFYRNLGGASVAMDAITETVTNLLARVHEIETQTQTTAPLGCD